jgi:hypothetical protein
MFLDIGIGILAALLISASFHAAPSVLLFVVGILFALGPDVDFLFHLIRKHDPGKFDFEHRDTLHFPLLYLPIGTVGIFFLFGATWATLFFITSLAHFIHDSMGIGWGIKWLYPFSENNIAFFYLYSGRLKEGLRKPLFVFDRSALMATAREHGEDDWVRKIYCAWHPIAIIEFSVFIISIITLYLYVR